MEKGDKIHNWVFFERNYFKKQYRQSLTYTIHSATIKSYGGAEQRDLQLLPKVMVTAMPTGHIIKIQMLSSPSTLITTGALQPFSAAYFPPSMPFWHPATLHSAVPAALNSLAPASDKACQACLLGWAGFVLQKREGGRKKRLLSCSVPKCPVAA